MRNIFLYNDILSILSACIQGYHYSAAFKIPDLCFKSIHCLKKVISFQLYYIYVIKLN